MSFVACVCTVLCCAGPRGAPRTCRRICTACHQQLLPCAQRAGWAPRPWPLQSSTRQSESCTQRARCRREHAGRARLRRGTTCRPSPSQYGCCAQSAASLTEAKPSSAFWVQENGFRLNWKLRRMWSRLGPRCQQGCFQESSEAKGLLLNVYRWCIASTRRLICRFSAPKLVETQTRKESLACTTGDSSLIWRFCMRCLRKTCNTGTRAALFGRAAGCNLLAATCKTTERSDTGQ